jgi:hypothetical protein
MMYTVRNRIKRISRWFSIARTSQPNRLISLTYTLIHPSSVIGSKGDECPEKSAYVGHCRLEASESGLPLFIDETHSRE